MLKLNVLINERKFFIEEALLMIPFNTSNQNTEVSNLIENLIKSWNL